MPQIIARYNPDFVPKDQIRPLGHAIIPLVAEAASTDSVPFTSKDIEWIPQALEAGAIAPILSLELRTIGYPDRKAKMSECAMLALKEKILALPEFSSLFLNWEQPLIWVQFMNPDGVHV